MKKILFSIFIITFSFLNASDKNQSVNSVEQKNIQPKKSIDKDLIDRWDNEDDNIKNDEYLNAVDRLKQQFDEEKKRLTEVYNKKIEPIRNEHNNSIKKLKDKFNQKRKELRKKHGIKKNKKANKLKPVRNKPTTIINNQDIYKKPLKKESNNIAKPVPVINKKLTPDKNIKNEAEKKDDSKK